MSHTLPNFLWPCKFFYSNLSPMEKRSDMFSNLLFSNTTINYKLCFENNDTVLSRYNEVRYSEQRDIVNT